MSENEMPVASDLDDVPVIRQMLPLIKAYTSIAKSGKAAVHPKRFATREEATRSSDSFQASIEYYARRHPELGIKAEYGYRIWDSREGGYRWAMLPTKHHQLPPSHPWRWSRVRTSKDLTKS